MEKAELTCYVQLTGYILVGSSKALYVANIKKVI